MSLVGKLEDLGLGEILQIVALSGKSGILHIKSNNRVGKIYFHKGKVIKAFSDAYRVNLGEVLIRKGYVSPEIIKKALEKQREINYREKLGSLLINEFNIPKEKIEECVIDLIEKSVFSFFYWSEGDFKFELTDDIESEAIKLDLLQYDLTQSRGLNPQFLAMEGSRIIDERRKEGVTREGFYQEFAIREDISKGEAESAVIESFEKPEIVYVDDFTPIRIGVKRIFEDKGYQVTVFESAEDAAHYIESVDSHKLMLITSLIIPKKDGSGILGGLDLVKKFKHKNNVKILVVSDYSMRDAEEELTNLNISLTKKPKRSQLTKENIKGELDFYIKTLEKSVDDLFAKSDFEKRTSENWDREIKEEFNIEEEHKPVTTTPGLTILKSIMLELTQATSGNEIILMILRLASEIMPRGIVFAIKGSRLHGLGQFGLERFIDNPQKTVKSLTFEIDGKLKEIIDLKYPFRGKPSNDSFFIELYKKTGNIYPSEVIISVVYAGNKPIILFYGDNLPHKRPIEDTDALEIFLTQAGIAMERLLIEKKHSIY